ncbi:GerAB/ArcD/ProY family transporter [Thalassobacillus devorans]|uniref:GerAB/ArcD/ProY family transporter n=1 Tax=Thalassobacillus devorans TaxID=279813 RepID=UPI000A1CD38F|nr:GerAB/ArcD/ProY family transporter [Thalassobacillus devorans]
MNNTNKIPVPEHLLVTSTMVFLLVHSMQVGVGILGFEKYIAMDAGYDAWISILIAGVAIHLLLFMIYWILEANGGDLVSIHTSVYGKILGGLLNIGFSFYFLLLSLTVLRTFTEIIQVWVFPQMSVWMFALAYLLLAYYFITGGLRIVVGMCLLSVILGLPLLLFKFFPIQNGQVDNVYPLVDHSINEILVSAKTSTLSFLGFELLLVFYPFIKNAASSKKWAHFASFYTTMIYLASALVAFIYYSEEQLQFVTWGTISLWKIVDFPFMQRFEYMGIALWAYVVLPNICLGLWAASRIPKRMFNIKQKYILILYMVIVFIATIRIDDRNLIDGLNTFTNQIGFYFLMYIPVLFVLTWIMKKVRIANES